MRARRSQSVLNQLRLTKHISHLPKQPYYQGIGFAHDRYSSFIHAASSAVGATPTAGFAGFIAAAESTYSAALAAASSNLESLRIQQAVPLAPLPSRPRRACWMRFRLNTTMLLPLRRLQLAAASSRASEGIYGHETGVAESLGSAASSALSGSRDTSVRGHGVTGGGKLGRSDLTG